VPGVYCDVLRFCCGGVHRLWRTHYYFDSYDTRWQTIGAPCLAYYTGTRLLQRLWGAASQNRLFPCLPLGTIPAR